MAEAGAERMYGMLARNHRLVRRIDRDDFPRAAFATLQEWQQTRLARTYSDLLAQDAYNPAVTFFLSEIYGGLDFRNRDKDMHRVMPVMQRFLPDKVLYIFSEAFELQALSIEFDMKMAGSMEQAGYESLDMQSYGATYRACSDRTGRERQIHLIRKLGNELGKLVNKPFVNRLVRLLRGPAHATGFGQLQAFLESGLGSFRAMDDINYFNETIFRREWCAMLKLFAGEENPFGLD